MFIEAHSGCCERPAEEGVGKVHLKIMVAMKQKRSEYIWTKSWRQNQEYLLMSHIQRKEKVKN